MIRLCNKLETMAKEKGAGSYLPLCPSNRTQSMQLNIALLYLSLIWALRHRWSPQKAQWYRVVQLNKIVDAKQRHVNQGHPYAGRTHKDTVWMAPYLVYTLYLPSVVTLIAQLKYFHQTRFVPLILSQRNTEMALRGIWVPSCWIRNHISIAGPWRRHHNQPGLW